jgi:hypothetical protein
LPPPAAKAKRPTHGMTRPQGVLMLAIGLGLGAFNVYSLQRHGKYYPKAMLITPVSILVGLFAIAVGSPKDPQTGLLPLWVRIGYGATGILGVGLGILAIVFVGC